MNVLRKTILEPPQKQKKGEFAGKYRVVSPIDVVQVETFINPFVDKTQHLKG